MSNNLRHVHVSSIRDRAAGDTRIIDPAHVVALAESIGIVSLLEPIVVDQNLRLLAGAHRRSACVLVSEGDNAKRKATFLKMVGKQKVDDLEGLARRVHDLDRSVWLQRHPDGTVPIRMVEIDASKDSEGALRVELTENEQRRDYTRDEIIALAKRLREAGYIDRAGRPRKGEKAMRPVLAAIIGKSHRFVRGLMNAKKGGMGAKSVGGWDRAIVGLRRAVAVCQANGRRQSSTEAKRLLALLGKVGRLVSAA